MKKIIFLSILFVVSCSENDKNSKADLEWDSSIFQVFEKVNASKSNVHFKNILTQKLGFSNFVYDYFQNGGGVAISDFDNDGLKDLFFTANQSSDKIYKNKGGFQFEDVTEKAGVQGYSNGDKVSWSNGVAIGDVNGDGYDDIFVCKGGPYKESSKLRNILYINNRDFTFTDKTEAYGILSAKHTIHASFFDMDNDNDLDLFVLNHSTSQFRGNVTDLISLESSDPNFLKQSSNTLYRNDGGKFVEVTLEAGLQKYGFGLGVITSDINDDGWVDIYATNDYSRPDFIYINQKDGTFKEEVKERTSHLSYYSMGVDFADINNDGLSDFSTTEMAPATNFRSKTLMPSMRPKNFYGLFDTLGFQFQYMHNSVQLNNGYGYFSEIAKLAKMHKTDWSWATLLADFDNDGLKDNFVSNGFKWNRMQNDFQVSLDSLKRFYKGRVPNDIKRKWINLPPSYNLTNIAFKNMGDLKFKKVSSKWGLKEKSFSNGAAYADLDNDGDLDLVINNLDKEAFLYENKSKANYLDVKLQAGNRKNLALTLNAKVFIYYGDKLQMQEQILTRGFMSSSTDLVHFGLGNIEKLDSVVVIWRGGYTQKVENVKSNQVLIIDKTKAKKRFYVKKETLFKEPRDFGKSHIENSYNDFEAEILLPHKNSQYGPKISVADVNGDGLEDFFVGGASGQEGQLFIQSNTGFSPSKNQPWGINRLSEDINNHFFDADGDGDLDLYVVSGGNEFLAKNKLYQDRLYLNDGKGRFSLSNLIPPMNFSGSVAVSGDFNNDGKLDLFIGNRMVPRKYPYAEPSKILLFENGKFVDKTDQFAPDLKNIGIVTDARIQDIDMDGKPDLVIVGEWTAVHVFKNTGTSLVEVTSEDQRKQTGWWSHVNLQDLDGDGDLDIIAGNLGLNYKYSASKEEPFHVYANDFDKNGSLDIVLGYFNEGTCYPLRGRECTSEQMPKIKEKFPTYASFASASLKDVYGKDLETALHLQATDFRSCIFINEGGFNFTPHFLPRMAQVSCVNGSVLTDIDNDGIKDLLIVGNMFHSEPETPRNDASFGLALKGDGKGNFETIHPMLTGLNIKRDAKDIEVIKTKNGIKFLISNNDSPLQILELN